MLRRVVEKVEKLWVSYSLLDKTERGWYAMRVCSVLWLSVLVALLVAAHIIGSQPGWEPIATRAPDQPLYALKYFACAISVPMISLAYLVRRSAFKPTSWVYFFTGSYDMTMALVPAFLMPTGVLGFLVFILEGSYLWLYLLVGVSAVALVLLRPRAQDLIDLGIRPKGSS